MKEWIKPQ